MLRLIFGTSFLHHSEFLIQVIPTLSATFIWTRWFNLLHTAITFHHFSLFHARWAQNLPFQEILSYATVCFCQADESQGSKPFTVFLCSSVYMF